MDIFRASLELINGWLFSHLAISEGVGLKNPVFRLNKSLGSAFEKERNTYAHPHTHTHTQRKNETSRPSTNGHL